MDDKHVPVHLIVDPVYISNRFIISEKLWNTVSEEINIISIKPDESGYLIIRTKTSELTIHPSYWTSLH